MSKAQSDIKKFITNLGAMAKGMIAAFSIKMIGRFLKSIINLYNVQAKAEAKLHFTYKIVNIINGKFYIGKHSTFNIEKTYLGSSIILDYYIKKYGRENFIMCDLEFFDTEDEAYIHEEKLLNEIWYDALSYDPFICYNISGGGKGAGSGEKNPMYGKTRKHSEESKQKMRESASGEKNPNWGETLSEDYRRKISEAKKGVEHRDKIKRYPSINIIAYNKTRKVYKYDRYTGKFLCEYINSKIATEMTDSHIERINSCCRRITKTSGGFCWSWERKDYLDMTNLIRIGRIGRVVYQYNMNGEFINKFLSIAHASKLTKVRERSIYKCVYGKRKSTGGYQWSFKNKKKLDKYINNTPISKAVYQYDKKTGKLIDEFPSIGSAKKAMNVSHDYLSDCLHGKSKSACGYLWNFIKQENIFQYETNDSSQSQIQA